MLRDERFFSRLHLKGNFQWIALDHAMAKSSGSAVLTVARYREVPEVALELRSEPRPQ